MVGLVKLGGGSVSLSTPIGHYLAWSRSADRWERGWVKRSSAMTTS
jgi:hypothetical protein